MLTKIRQFSDILKVVTLTGLEIPSPLIMRPKQDQDFLKMVLRPSITTLHHKNT